MTTKEQERKALELIKRTIESLGEGSYIGTAFAGCIEDAEENIENDFALSMKDRWEKAEELNKAQVETMRQNMNDIKQMEAKIDDLKAKLDESHKLGESLAMKLDDERARRKEASDSATECWNKLQEAETRLDEKENEIIRLKAKLYDLLVK